MDYKSSLDYVLSFADYERLPRSALVFDLRRIERLLAKLGNPQDAAKSVNIAGTKGKGSTAAMVASILTRSGCRTGLYTSPHLLTFTERIKIDGENIAEDSFARLVDILKPEIEEANRLGVFGELTTFEILTALAFAYFSEMKVDYQVLETGLGGRLDATNVAKPEVCAITSVSLDHMDVLGDTLSKIATEKAGIIKPGSIVACSPQFPEAMEAIERTCRKQRARLIKVGTDVTWKQKGFSHDVQSFELRGLRGEYDLKLPLLGDYQMENAAMAVTIIEVLIGQGANIKPESIAEGLAQVQWPGRLQTLRRQPRLIIDGAHNAYSAKKLVEAIKQHFDFTNAFLILGASSDKDVAGMVAELSLLTKNVIVTGSRHPRAVKPAVLAGEFSKRGITAGAAEDVASAVEMALAGAKADDLICATGSIFVIAEVMEHMAKLS